MAPLYPRFTSQPSPITPKGSGQGGHFYKFMLTCRIGWARVAGTMKRENHKHPDASGWPFLYPRSLHGIRFGASIFTLLMVLGGFQGDSTMAANRDPAFPMYAMDFIVDRNVVFMELDEIGAYTLLLCHQWIEGEIPVEDEQITRLLGPRATRPEIVVSMKKMFPISKAGGRRNPRLEEERIKRKRYKESQKERAKHAAKVRWDKEKDAARIDLAMPKHALSSSSSSSSSSSKDITPPTPQRKKKPLTTVKGPAKTLCADLTARWCEVTGQRIKPTPGREKKIKSNLGQDPGWGDKAKQAMDQVGEIDDSRWPHGKKTFEWFCRMKNYAQEYDPVVDRILSGVYGPRKGKAGPGGRNWLDIAEEIDKRGKENQA